MRAELILLAAYAAVLVPLLSLLPLWVDEVLQLIGTRSATLLGLLQWCTFSVGATPLAYFVQRGAIQAFGYSMFVARLPAAFFGVASVAAAGLLARRLGLKHPILAMALFALLPLNFRYALEARVYSQAVFLSILSTLAFLWFRERPGWRRGVAYCLTVAAALYTMPYAFFVALAHFIRAPRLTLAPVMAAGCMFLPWYLYARDGWARGSVQSGNHFHADWKTPLMMLKEITGAGYVGGVLLLAAASLGFILHFAPVKRSEPGLLLATVFVPLLGALVVDFASGYFIAIRQVIFILPALILLAAASPRIMVVALLAVSLVADVRWFLRPREDWAIAARALRETGACIVVAPERSTLIYTFFEPLRACTVNDSAVAIAVTPYTSDAEERKAVDEFERRGFTSKGTQSAGRTLIMTYARPSN